MRSRRGVNLFFGRLAAFFLPLFGKSDKITSDDLKKGDFSANTQKIGVRFTEKLRGKFRLRWIKRHGEG